VGAGGSQDAPYTLVDKVPAGTYHLVLDAVIVASCDVTFDLIWRHAGNDTVLVEWIEHYDPRGGGNFDAQPFEYDEDAPAIDTLKGDQLVFRYTANAASPLGSYVPNGDGPNSHGRIPSIALPPK
jgi:hypothetical protein